MTHVNQCFLLTPIQTGRRLQPETAKPHQVPIRNQRSIRETHREGHSMRCTIRVNHRSIPTTHFNS